MGVVNVTPDSFSDGGLWFDPDRAVAHGLELAAQGADLVDVGGESTRPGAERVELDEELRRVVPVVRELAAAGVRVSVDTMRAEVAERAVEAGAVLVNDVSGGRADPRVLRVAADAGVPFVLMHWRQHSATMQQHAVYDDVVREVLDELRSQVDLAVAAGVPPEHLVVDPGLGFSKNADHNWTVLSRLGELHALGLPLLVAASRKRFLGQLLAGEDGEPVPVARRESATTAVTALAAAAGAWCVRVHEVPANLDAVRVAARWTRG
ncbi:dihydropteroate synthase [Solicola sp. PLA-1-18]|uniref:dihydropteroate synthase n=1 Tax=Solicola sp. PLA-1-18 TaxID=3380532 RepID=UPI003B7F1198